MLSCKDVTQKISQGQDDPLTLRERISVKLHLLICYACRRFSRQLALLKTASRRVMSENAPTDNNILSEEARQRIRERLQTSSRKPGSPE